jgi:hypothetical protein
MDEPVAVTFITTAAALTGTVVPAAPPCVTIVTRANRIDTGLHATAFPVRLFPGEPLRRLRIEPQPGRVPTMLPDEFLIRELLDATDDESLAALRDQYGEPIDPNYDRDIDGLDLDAPGWLLQVQALAWTIVGYLEDSGTLAAAWTEARSAHRAGAKRFGPPPSEDNVWHEFGLIMDLGLRTLGPVVIAVDEPSGDPISGLFEACCVDIYNLLLDPLPFRRMEEGLEPFARCANETCGRRFLRQRGTAKKGQHRTSGVTYCSYRCANTQVQRNRRREMRESNA